MRVLHLTYRARALPALLGLAWLGAGPDALAQDPPVIQPLPPEPQPQPLPPAPVERAPTQPAPAEPAPAQPPPLQTAPAEPSYPGGDPMQGEFPPPPPMAPPPPVQEVAPNAGEGLRLSAFVDANYGFQTQARGTPSPVHRAFAWNRFVEQPAPQGLALNGFNLSFAGLDATYDGGNLAATISLRAGSSVPVYYFGDTGVLGIDNVTQAYATWNPTSQLSIDFGQFSTIYGAEVAESWRNLNYTRGALYYAMQPFWHTGVRATVAPNDQVAVTGMVVNGVNTLHDDNDTPSLGLQLSLTPNDTVSLAAGWLTTLKPSTDGGIFDNFFDLVAAITADRFSLVFNADLTLNGDTTREGEGYEQEIRDPLFWGVSLAAAYQATDMFGLALRGEFLSDGDNQLYQALAYEAVNDVTYPHTQNTNVATVTATLDFKPIEGSNNLVIRWDNRFETSNEDIFFNRSSEETDVWFGSVLGVVVTTDD